MREWKYESMHICLYTSGQEWKYAIIQVYKYVSMQVYNFMYESMQLCDPPK